MMKARSSVRFLYSFALFVAVAVIAVCIFVTRHPNVLALFSQRYLGGARGDGGLYVWLVQLFVNDPQPALAFETNGMYPYPLSRAWSDSFLLPSLAAYALCMLGLPLPAAYNAVLLIAVGANGGAAYLLARRLGIHHLFAVACGLVFANSSYFLGNIGHPQLLFFFWIPLAWLAVLPTGSTRRAPTGAWFAAGLCVSGAFYCAVYYAIFAALGLAVLWTRELMGRIASMRRALRTLLAVCFAGMPIVYALPGYLAVQGYFGTRGSYEADAFAASGASYLAFTPLHDLYGATAQLSHSEAYLGVGYFILTLAVVGTARLAYGASKLMSCVAMVALVATAVASSTVDASTQSEWIVSVGSWLLLVGALGVAARLPAPYGIWFALVSVFLVLSFGPGGNVVKGEPGLSPLGVLFERVPGLSAIRAAGRFGSIVVLALVFAAARELQRIVLRRERSEPEHVLVAVLSAGALCGVGLLENSVSVLPFDAPDPMPQAVVAHAAEPGVKQAAVYVPWSGSLNQQGMPEWSEFAVLHSTYALWSSAARPFPIVNGYSGQRSKIQAMLNQALENFPSERSFHALAKVCGVKKVIGSPHSKTLDAAQVTARLSGEFSKYISRVQPYDDGSLAIGLAAVGIAVNDGDTATLFGPRHGVTSMVLEPIETHACSVSVASVTRGEDGALVPLHTQSFQLTGRQEIRLIPPSGLSRASPHVISVSVKGCKASVMCDAIPPARAK